MLENKKNIYNYQRKAEQKTVHVLWTDNFLKLG